MSDERFLQNGFDKTLSHAIEECGELITVAGKLQRWGSHSHNPIYREVPDGSRGECNAHWLWREIQDVKKAMHRLEQAMLSAFDDGFFDQDDSGEFTV